MLMQNIFTFFKRQTLEKGEKYSPNNSSFSSNKQLRALKMGKIWIEICLISARGLRRTSSLFKLQWYAVGWIDSKTKYCTRVDACGNTNPMWKTKFSAVIDDSESSFENLSIQVEVYSRDPIFLRERLQGTATVVLKEFLDKFVRSSDGYKTVEEVGSFQLWKHNSNKPRGFVDVSIQVSKEKEDPNIYKGENGGIKLLDYNYHINPSTNQYNGPSQINLPHLPLTPIYHPENHPQLSNPPYLPTNPNLVQGGPSYTSAGGPSKIGYTPSIFPKPEKYHNLPTSYMSMPRGGAGRGSGAAFGMGLGSGALATGAVIFGDDLVSSLSGLHNPSLTIATDPPFQ